MEIREFKIRPVGEIKIIGEGILDNIIKEILYKDLNILFTAPVNLDIIELISDYDEKLAKLTQCLEDLGYLKKWQKEYVDNIRYEIENYKEK